LINQVVQELTYLGFSPEVVRDLVKQGNGVLYAMREKSNPDERTAVVVQSYATTNPGLRLLYEVGNDLGHLVPRLRIVVNKDDDMDIVVSETNTTMTRILTWDVEPNIPILASWEDSPADS